MMLGVIRKLFVRQLEAVPEEPVFQTAGEPTSVGVGLEHDLRELAALAREFEPLFAYRPDLIPLVTEVSSQHTAEGVRALLQEASDGERSRLKQSLGGIQPHLTQLGNSEELQGRLEAMLMTLETTLPTRATLDHLHGLYAHELMRLPAPAPSQTEVMSPLKTAASLDDLALQLPNVYEQSLGAQDKTIAELKVLMMGHQTETSGEYQDFVVALTSLQIAQDSHLIAPELVMRARDAYHLFESTKQHQSQSRRAAQRLHLEGLLKSLQALPILPTMQKQLESAKSVFADYRDQLTHGLLEDHALASAEALLHNYKTHLDLSYRHDLMNLVDRATLAKATGILVDLQHAGQMLDEGNYPDLGVPGDALHRYLEAEKHRLSSLCRNEKFQKKIEAARTDFERLDNLSHEEVEGVRQSLSYIEGQRDYFQSASLVVQRELGKRLTKTITTIKRLTKYYEVTCAVAEELMTSNVLDTLFDEIAAEKVATPQPTSEVITGVGNSSSAS